MNDSPWMLCLSGSIAQSEQASNGSVFCCTGFRSLTKVHIVYSCAVLRKKVSGGKIETTPVTLFYRCHLAGAPFKKTLIRTSSLSDNKYLGLNKVVLSFRRISPCVSLFQWKLLLVNVKKHWLHRLDV